MSTSEWPEERLSAYINVRVPAPVHAQIAKAAEGNNATLSDFVREAIRKAMESAKAPGNAQAKQAPPAPGTDGWGK